MKALLHGIVSGTVVSLAVLVPFSAQAKKVTDLVIINHFDKSLTYTVGTNPELLPDLPQTFSLATGDQIGSKVADLQKEAYIRAEDSNSHSAFFGVELVDNTVKFHGYVGKGIAYSWNTRSIVFCTPEEYKQKHSCF
jgi:hypothetical protein